MKKVIEQHFDDAGEDLSGLGEDIYYMMFTSDEDDDTSGGYDAIDLPILIMTTYVIRGTGATNGLGRPSLQAFIASDMTELGLLATADRQLERHDDIFEVCGGAERLTTVAIHRHVQSGPNRDRTSCCDFTTEKEQQARWSYVSDYKHETAILQPPCTPFGPLCHFDYTNNYDDWKTSYDQRAPVARLRGHIAFHQLSTGFDYPAEQHVPSQPFIEPPWPIVAAHPDNHIQIMHRCRTGQADKYGRLQAKGREDVHLVFPVTTGNGGNPGTGTGGWSATARPADPWHGQHPAFQAPQQVGPHTAWNSYQPAGQYAFPEIKDGEGTDTETSYDPGKEQIDMLDILALPHGGSSAASSSSGLAAADAAATVEPPESEWRARKGWLDQRMQWLTWCDTRNMAADCMTPKARHK